MVRAGFWQVFVDKPGLQLLSKPSKNQVLSSFREFGRFFSRKPGFEQV
jgi:hypothetical protein